MKHVFTAMFLVFIGFGVYMYSYLGMWKPVVLEVNEQPVLKMIAKAHTGPYFKIVPAIEAVETWAKSKNIDCRLSFGEYFDNPDTTEEARLRSRGGCLVSDFPTEIPEGFETAEIPARKYVQATFEGAPSIGPYKVYAKAKDYIVKNRLEQSGPVIEIYEVKSAKEVTTKYMFPVK